MSLKRIAFGIIGIIGLLLCSGEINAMPNFARKYNADCSMCHTQVPKLNRLGYEFRLAGYRLPSEIGKDEKPFNLGDFFVARIQQQYNWRKHEDIAEGKSFKTNQLEFFELTLYPLTGSWGKYFGSIVEISMAPDDVFELENAYVRGVMGNQNLWYQARVGIMHPWEGFGASDRPLDNIRPLFQRNTAIGSPFFLWNLDEEAFEAGVHVATTGTSISARISNGIIWKEDGSGVAEPAQGGGLSKNPNQLASDRKNYQVFINQFITDTSSISLYWYHGIVPFVDPNLAGTTGNTLDTFNRYAAYANFWVVPNFVNLLGGYEYGRDSLDNGNLITSGTDAEGNAHNFNASRVGKDSGYFGEIDVHPSSKLALGARYDQFDPSSSVHNNSLYAYTGFFNYYITNGLQFITDYQHKETQQGAAGGRNTDKQLLARLILIW